MKESTSNASLLPPPSLIRLHWHNGSEMRAIFNSPFNREEPFTRSGPKSLNRLSFLNLNQSQFWPLKHFVSRSSKFYIHLSARDCQDQLHLPLLYAIILVLQVPVVPKPSSNEWNLQSTVYNLQFELFNLKSTVWNLQSTICSLKSKH